MDKNLKFVMKNYRDGVFDTERSLKKLEVRLRKTDAAFGVSVKRRKIFRLMSMFAAVIMLAILACGYYIWVNAWTTYSADAVAETFVLPDSSKVILAPGATLRVQKHKDMRHVTMSGKVFFNIFSDISSPFRVSVEKCSVVEVIGTQFQVNQTVSTVQVDVLEGTVRFGQSVLSDGMSAIEKMSSGRQEMITREVLNPMTWATGRFVYDDACLHDVMQDLSVYYHVVVKADGPVVNKRITGTFPATELGDVLDMIGQACGVRLSD